MENLHCQLLQSTSIMQVLVVAFIDQGGKGKLKHCKTIIVCSGGFGGGGGGGGMHPPLAAS